jgi:ATPase family protein associated with various cellular activities (AAA)/winged helix domain-containing protein
MADAGASMPLSWLEQNQAYLGAEFARLRDRLSGTGQGQREQSSELERHAATVRATMTSPPAIDVLAELFGLTSFERNLLLLSAGADMDSRLAESCAEVHGNPQKTYATFGLALALLADSHWDAITPSRPLRRYRMLDVQRGSTLTSSPLRIDERVLHYLAGSNLLDPRLESFVRTSPPPGWIADDQRDIALRAARLLESYAQYSPLVHLCGDDPLGHEDIAAFAAHELGRYLVIVKADALPAVGPDLDQFALLWERESRLLPGALLVQGVSAELPAAASHLVERLPGVAFVSTREPVRLNRTFVRFDANKPGPVEQKQLWRRALGDAASTLNGTLDDISEQFRLSARMIASTGYLLGSREERLQADGLWDACRSLARPRLEDLAQRIVACATWDDLVLPELQKNLLRQLAAQVRHRMKVYESWGFAERGRRGLGVSALFTGASGTGKTMAAEALARELRLDLYRIDLSSVVSKYIGETEKNLKQVFDGAEEGGVLLLFDEADALFGKRSEVRDSHDRYANIEVGYLLQRIEAYQGLAVLTTNLKSSMDTAFQRRLRFTVSFPFPDAALREAIWKTVFPAATPTYGLDHKKLAQLNVTGGNIRNIALNAAFLAAEAGTPVQMANLIEAAKLEALKIERPLSDAETRGWV